MRQAAYRGLLPLIIVLSACSDLVPTAPAPRPSALPSADRIVPVDPPANAIVRWNEIARTLVADHATDPPMASRYYALLSIAQWLATEASPSQKAIDAASVAVLSYAFPDRSTWLQTQARESLGHGSAADRGRAAAATVLARAKSDGSGGAWSGSVPTGTGIWYSSIGMPPLRPEWANVRPWVLSEGSELRPLPPPTFGSSAYLAALHEVRAISDSRTADQLRIAEFWADGAGTITPPGHWNAIASEAIEKHHLSNERAAHVMALMNMALMDAGIACWDAKYHYWLIRPPQADPLITTPVGLPNFPSYVSGHATFSGAASEVLAHFFPEESDEFQAMADEAALSRLYAGIHYRFDNEVGLALGRAIGRLTIERELSSERQ